MVDDKSIIMYGCRYKANIMLDLSYTILLIFSPVLIIGIGIVGAILFEYDERKKYDKI